MASTSFSLPNQFVDRRFSSVQPPHSSNFRPSTSVSAAYATADRASATASSTGNVFQTAYDVLGIHSGATCQEIKSAYRKLARVLHPDVGSAAADEFMRVHAAYATLSDPEKRAVYDSSIMRRNRRPTSITAFGSPEMSRRRRTWETDQCW